METPSPRPSRCSPLPDAIAPEPSLALPWIVGPAGASLRASSKVARSPFSILDRCVIALTIVTAASLAWHGHAQSSHSRELLPVVVMAR